MKFDCFEDMFGNSQQTWWVSNIFDQVNELFKTVKLEYKFLDREKELVEVNYKSENLE